MTLEQWKAELNAKFGGVELESGPEDVVFAHAGFNCVAVCEYDGTNVTPLELERQFDATDQDFC